MDSTQAAGSVHLKVGVKKHHKPRIELIDLVQQRSRVNDRQGVNCKSLNEIR